MKSLNSVSSSGKDQLKLLFFMYIGYASFMVLKTAVVIAGPALLSDPGVELTKSQWGAILGYGTLGGIVGKFISGYLADRLGGRITFALGLVITSIGIGLFGTFSSFTFFAVTYFFVLLAKSAGWPSMAKLIGNWYRHDQYGKVWGALSTSSRVGTMVATLGLGALLYSLPWRQMLWVSAAMGLVLVVLFFFMVHENPKKQGTPQVDGEDEVNLEKYKGHHLYQADMKDTIYDFLTSKRVWLIGLSMMGLTVLWDFLNFVPLYLSDIIKLSNGDAATVTSAFPAGSFISVLVAGFFFDSLKKSSITKLISFMLTIAVFCVAALFALPYLGLPSAINFMIVIGSLFVFGFTVSPAYYLPMSIFSIDYGGPRSGFLIAYLDALGFAASMVFSFGGGAILDMSNGWNYFLVLLTAIAAFSLIVTFWFLKGEEKATNKSTSAKIKSAKDRAPLVESKGTV